MSKFDQLRRLNALEADLYKTYRQYNTDPRGERLCRALDILEAARSAIGQLANEESRAVNGGGKQ